MRWAEWVSAELRLPLFAFLVDATGLADSGGQSPNCAERVGEAGHTKHVKHSNCSSLAGKVEACWKHGKAWQKNSKTTQVYTEMEWFGMIRNDSEWWNVEDGEWQWWSKHIEAYQGTGGLQPRHSNEAWVDGMMEWWIYSYDKYYINMKGSVHRIYGESMYV